MILLLYLALLSIGSFIFLVNIRYLEFVEVRRFQEGVSRTKDMAEVIILVFEVSVDVIKDTIKYILIACGIALISLLIYAWELHEPRRWKAYSLLIVGLAFAWISAVPSEEVAKVFEGSGVIVKWTIAVIGHAYILTSIWQFAHTIKNKDYFREDIAARNAEVLNQRIDVVLRRKQSEAEYRESAMRPSGEKEEKFETLVRLMAIIWSSVLEPEIPSEAQIEQYFDVVWDHWNRLGESSIGEIDRIKLSLPGYRLTVMNAAKKAGPQQGEAAVVVRSYFEAMVQERVPKESFSSAWEWDRYRYRHPFEDFYKKLSLSERSEFIYVCCKYALAWDALLVDKVITDWQLNDCFDVVWHHWDKSLYGRDKDARALAPYLGEYARLLEMKAEEEQRAWKSQRWIFWPSFTLALILLVLLILIWTGVIDMPGFAAHALAPLSFREGLR